MSVDWNAVADSFAPGELVQGPGWNGLPLIPFCSEEEGRAALRLYEEHRKSREPGVVDHRDLLDMLAQLGAASFVPTELVLHPVAYERMQHWARLRWRRLQRERRRRFRKAAIRRSGRRK